MPTLAAWTIYLFGATAFVAGWWQLISPETAVKSLGLGVECVPAANGNSLAAIAMGIYYSLAAYQENRSFFKLTVPMRLLTATVFWGQGGMWKGAGLWEGLGAGLTGLALLLG
ncbi:hypothetical protein V8E51_016262 [Hyaloscypha variabilis]|uniref:Integral membrane protein n=1 Tax=Hyaloscypha variabilis (strain UAMH 11265 / GT02V1 / F) TaxID=1149755 RepID=A0A2J6RPT6_HYAVF|nr:hypothetical protein L207DRAFT_633524 [Hyaloscypha variabilis F]